MPPEPTLSASTLTDRLDAIRKTHRFDEEALAKLAAFIEHAPDEELFRTNPYRLSAHSGLAEQPALDLLLHATYAGLFEFAWGVLCPVCSAFLHTPAGLASIRNAAECRICSLPYQPSADDSVEVAFTVSPTVRRIKFHDPDSLSLEESAPMAFSTSVAFGDTFLAAAKQLAVGATKLPANDVVELAVTFEAGPHDLIALSHHAVARIVVSPEATASTAELDLLDTGLVPASIPLAPGPVRLRIRNRTGVGTMVVARRDPRPACMDVKAALAMGSIFPRRPYLTGKRVLTSQTFRDLFRTESVPGEQGLEFKSLTVLFTDLKGSTAMYERIGDFRAYGLVREHFALLKEILAARGGSMVKTIGDAIMASFSEAAPALEAAAAMNREIRKVGGGEDLLLKIGLHTGPCIAVDSNERLDYFGQTVNIAARVQGIAEASEIVCTGTVFGAPGVAEVLKTARLSSSREKASLKGIEERLDVVRLREIA